MLYPARDKSRKITKVVRRENALFLYSEHGMHRIVPKNARTVRVTYTNREDFSARKKYGVIAEDSFTDWSLEEKEEAIVLSLPELVVQINRETGSYSYFDSTGRLLLAENEKNSKELQSFMTYTLLEEEAQVEEIQTADGKKNVVREATRVPAGEQYHTKLNVQFQEGEHLYGLGQYEEGFGSLRGQVVYVHQGNRQIAVPMLVSTLGYGILMDTYSPILSMVLIFIPRFPKNWITI